VDASFRIWRSISELCQEARNCGDTALLRLLIPMHSRAVKFALKMNKACETEKSAGGAG
jgi:hypothetical protein